MKGGFQAKITPTAGFTIVEVMIFLAISSLMLILAISSLSGKQGQTEFDTGLATFISQLQSQINNVSSGYYNVPSNVTCTGSSQGAGAYPVISVGNGGAIGQNSECTYIGEVLAFGVSNNANSDQSYNVYPVVGLHYQDNQGPNEPTNLAEAHPETIQALATSTTMPYGLQIESMPYVSGGPGSGTNWALAFMTSFNSDNSSGGVSELNSGSQYVNFDPLPNITKVNTNDTASNPATDNANMVSKIDSLTDACDSTQEAVCYTTDNPPITAQVNPAAGFQMCINSGSTNQHAILTIGGPTGISTINDQIYDGQC